MKRDRFQELPSGEALTPGKGRPLKDRLFFYIIGVEDLIVDRLNAFVHWKSTDDEYWVGELIYIYFDTLDLDYLKDRCGDESHCKRWIDEGILEVVSLRYYILRLTPQDLDPCASL